MKKLFLLLAMTGAFGLWSCETDPKPEPPQPTLEVDESDMMFLQDASGKTISVVTNVADWTASVPEQDKGWCTLVPQKSATNGDKLMVRVTKNEEPVSRTTVVTVTADKINKEFSVIQAGSDPIIMIDKKSFSISARDTTINLKIVSNVEYEISSSEWIEQVTSKATVTEFVTFHIQNYDDAEESRKGEIVFTQTGGSKSEKVTINQAARVSGYNPGDLSSIKSDFKIVPSSGIASEFQYGAEIEKSFDGDISTVFHSKWGQDTRFPVTLDYYFTTDSQFDYMIYYPRQDGGYNGHFKQVEIWVAYSASEPSYTKIGSYDFKGSAAASIVTFDQPLQNPRIIRVKVLSGGGDYQGYATCAEMEFYRKTTENATPDVFTDNSCSALKPGTTLAQVDAISNEFFRNIATAMYWNEYPREYRITSYKAYPDPTIDAEMLRAKCYSLNDNPTGIVFEPGQHIVLVGPTHGRAVSLAAWDLTTSNVAKTYSLAEGVNKITVDRVGLVYVQYHTSTVDPTAQPITVHFPTGKVQGYFDAQKHTSADFTRMLDNAVYANIDLLGDKSIITFPVASLKQYSMNQPGRLVEIYDTIIYLQEELQGLIKYNKEHKNRHWFRVDPITSYMDATNYRTAYNKQTMSWLCDPIKLRYDKNWAGDDAVWGPAHEVGHTNQLAIGLMWIGLAEVSNNIASLYVQDKFRNSNVTRLSVPNHDAFVPARTSIVTGGIPHGESSDLFHKLVPFWQLYLYFVKTGNQPDFYKDVYETLRTLPNPSTDGAAQLQFVKVCCEVANMDLTDFFTDWGFLRPINKDINDYGTRNLTVTQSQIDALKTTIQTNYPTTPGVDITTITDSNYASFAR